MTRGRLTALVFVAMLGLTAVQAFADDVFQRLESIVLDTFDNPTERRWTADGRQFSEARQWVAVGSKFATEDFPKVAYADVWPAALFDTNPDNLDLKVLGIQAKFDRKGFNYIEIFPTKENDEGQRVHAPLAVPGVGKMIDLWVWGANYNYNLEVHLRDYRGIPYVLDIGNLRFPGWRNMRVNIPTYIPQGQTHLPNYQGLTITKFVVRTHPTERVDNFYIYLDQLKVLTDMHDQPFDGRDLIRPDFINRTWNRQ